jgi:hypothetical protein
MEPEIARVPDQEPPAVHDVAFVLDHVRVALWPGITALGVIESVAVALGAGGVFVVGDDPEPQPERTKADRNKATKTKE